MLSIIAVITTMKGKDKMGTIKFDLIEDSRFPHKPTINNLIDTTGDILLRLGDSGIINGYSMTNYRVINFNPVENCISKRITVSINHPRKNGLSEYIKKCINDKIPAPVYQ